MNEFNSSLGLSLRVASCATVLVAVVAIPLAFAMARRRFAGKGLIESLLALPLVLPPTVVGYGILVVMGRRGWIGQWLNESFGYSVMFHWHGAVLAAAVVAFPLLYIPTKSAFASVDRELEDIARICGANRLQLFWYVSLPLASRGIASGLLLAFARAIGEFGATVMVLGDIARYQTLPIVIYNNHFATTPGLSTLAAVAALTGVSLVIILAHNRIVETHLRTSRV